MVMIPDVITVCTGDDLLRAVGDGYTVAMGGEVESRTHACLAAQVSLETGNGEKMHCWNPGNRKLPKDWAGLTTQFKCDEIFDAATARRAQILGPCEVHEWHDGKKRVVLFPPHPWSTFVAFETAREGFGDYINHLAMHFPSAWHCALKGDPDGFSRSLRVGGYYTADVQTYTAGLVRLYNQLLPACRRLAEGRPGLTDEEQEQIRSLVVLTISDSRAYPERYPLGDVA